MAIEIADYTHEGAWSASPCIIAPGRPANSGYGRITRNGKTYLAHRYAYEQAHGPIPPGRRNQVHHLCHVKMCMNPVHLQLMDQRDHLHEHGLTGMAAVHAVKTTCPQGHPYDKATKRQRSCSICHREAVRRHDKKRRAA